MAEQTFWQKALPPKEEDLTPPSKVTGKRYLKRLGRDEIIRQDMEEEARQASFSGAKAGPVSAGIGRKGTATESTRDRESREAQEQSDITMKNAREGVIATQLKKVEDVIMPGRTGPTKEVINPQTGLREHVWDTDPEKVKGYKQLKETGSLTNLGVESVASTYDDVTNQIPADWRIGWSVDAKPIERVGAFANIAARGAGALASVVPAVSSALKLSTKAVNILMRAAKAGDVGAIRKIEQALSTLPEGRLAPETPKPKSIAEAVEMSEPGYEFRPRTDPKSGRTLTTEANLDEHLTQSIEELSPPKTIQEAVARAEVSPASPVVAKVEPKAGGDLYDQYKKFKDDGGNGADFFDQHNLPDEQRDAFSTRYSMDKEAAEHAASVVNAKTHQTLIDDPSAASDDALKAAIEKQRLIVRSTGARAGTGKGGVLVERGADLGHEAEKAALAKLENEASKRGLSVDDAPTQGATPKVETPSPVTSKPTGTTSPMRLYHGTQENVSGGVKDGSWWSPDQEFADAFSKKTNRGNKPSQIVDREFDPEKVADFSDKEIGQPRSAEEIAKKLGITKDDLLSRLNANERAILEGNERFGGTPGFVAIEHGGVGRVAKELGFDAIKGAEKMDAAGTKLADTYKVFDKTTSPPVTSKVGEGVDPQKTGLANVVQDAEAEAGVLKESPRAEGSKKGDAHAEGKRLVESGEVDPETLAREIATGKRTFKDESEVGALLEGKRRILQRVNQAKTKLDDLLEKGEDATDATAEYAKAQTDLQEFVDNVQQGKGKWSDIGRALQEGTDISEGQFVEVLAEYRRQGGKNPKIEKQLEDLIKQRDDLQAQLTAQEAKAAKAKLGEDLKTRKAPAMKREELDAELDTLLKDFSDANAKATVGIDPKAVVVLGKIVANRVKYGAATVEELIISVKQVFKDRGLPEPDDTDILKAYAGESKPKTTRPPSMLSEAKRELALIEKRDALLEGLETPSSPKAQRVKSKRIQELEDEIAAIQAEAKNEDRVERTVKGSQARAERKANRPAELDQAYKEKLRAEIAEMEAGTYTPVTKKQKVLDRETEMLKAKRDLMKDQIRSSINAGKPKNPFEVVNTVLNIPRSSMASMDVSYGGRQGWLGLFNDPVSWGKGWGDQSAAMFKGEDHAMAVFNATVRDNPNLPMYKKMKLHLNTPDGSLASGEEAMRGNILARVGWKKFNPWRSSDRGFNAFANTQRTGMADTFVNRAKKWKGSELTKEEYEQLGHTINTLTGRGGTSVEAFNKAAEFLSFGLFSPRFLASRIEMISGAPMWGTLFRRNVSPKVKALVAKEWAQSMGGVGLATTGVYYGAQAAFGKDNVRFVSDSTSTDFGKVIIKDPNSSKETRIDTAAGMLQPIVLGSKFKQLKRMKADGKSVDLVKGYGESLEREAGRFFRSKLNPAFGIMWNLGTGKDMVGKDYDWKNAARDMTIPLTEKEMIEGLVEDGWNRSDALGFLNLIGITTNAYGNDKPKKGPSAPKAATKLPRPGQ